VLLVVTQFVMQKWMTPTPAASDDSQVKMTQNMSLVMTLFFGFFTLQVPAGLTLYWVTSNLLQMAQQWGVTKFFIKPAKPMTASAATSATVPAASAAPALVDSKATKATSAAGGASGSSTSGAKTSKPANRPKAKGK
jgi:YidC/Oxa1 family membrane protein insertase